MHTAYYNIRVSYMSKRTIIYDHIIRRILFNLLLCYFLCQTTTKSSNHRFHFYKGNFNVFREISSFLLNFLFIIDPVKNSNSTTTIIIACRAFSKSKKNHCLFDTTRTIKMIKSTR